MSSSDPDLNEEEHRAVRAAIGFREDDKRPSTGDLALRSRDEAAAALKAAKRAARRGALAEAKQWSEVAKRLTETYQRLIEAPPPQSSWEEEEARRAELRERIAKYCGDEHERDRWLMRKEIWDEMAAEARRTGAPMPSPLPPLPPHWSDDLPEDLRRKIGLLVE